MHKFENKETFITFQWLNNTDEFYGRICRAIDEVPYNKERVTTKVKEIVDEIVKSVDSGLGSKAAHYMLDDVGNYKNINYYQLVNAFTEE